MYGVMISRICLIIKLSSLKMQRAIYKSSSRSKTPLYDPDHSAEKQESRGRRCASCTNIQHIYGLGCINRRGLLILCIIFLCVVLTVMNVFEMHRVEVKQNSITSGLEEKILKNKPGFFVYGNNIDSGYLKHVFLVFERLGYEHHADLTSDWDVMWAHMYPFRNLYSQLQLLEPHQKVNHFPGSGYLTHKVHLATSGYEYVPPAFKVPADVEKLKEYALQNPESLFVQKNNGHRGIRVTHADEVDVKAEDTFVQEFISRPLLVDGYKFDIGVYAIQTSIDPLRVYIYDGDVLLRFCMEKYYPFDAKVLEKYVVGDDYLPTWQVPSLQKYYVDLGFSMKDSLSAYLRANGMNASKIWDQIDDAIRKTYLRAEPSLLRSVSQFNSKHNFFEMVRFDFVVDEDLNVYIMEVNMSPNLSSQHYPPNRLLYEQVLFNTLSLVGVGRKIHSNSLRSRSTEEGMMQVSDKNLAVFPHICARKLCRNSCMSPECHVCKPCLTEDAMKSFRRAYLEHVNRQDCKRIFPPRMTVEDAKKSINFEEFSPENQLMYRWFQGKCLLDASWC